MRKRRALVAMSGGVDSAVAVHLALREGYEVLGVTLSLCPHAKGGDEEDLREARLSAERMGIEHLTLTATDVFAREVMAPFVASYEAGETPNPCILCNRHLKFGLLLSYAEQHGFDVLVTGHYARSVDGHLYRALCTEKDQSYVLYFLTEAQLRRIWFPLGTFASKEEVRAVATSLGLSSAARRESQDICFIPDGDYGSFIERYTGRVYPSGAFVTVDGRTVGQHRGLIHYTVGQRKGLGVAMGEPIYVKEKRPDGTVVLAEDAQLLERCAHLRQMSLVRPTEHRTLVCEVKPRYRARAASACVTLYPDGRATVLFEEPQRALTPGQAAVLYADGEVLGGGIIDSVGEEP